MRALTSLCAVLLLACGTPAAIEDPELGGSTGTLAEPPPDCDPATQRSFCEGNEVVRCSEDGFFEWEACGGRNRCAQGSEGAACVWRLGEVCEGDLVQCRDPGGILRCEGRWTFEGCPFGGTCISNGENSFCAGPEQELCDYGDYAPVCTDVGVTQCAFGVVEELPCAGGEVCRDGLHGGVCVPADAQPCDPEELESRCLDDAVAEYCDPTTGWTLPLPCDEGDRCFEGEYGAACAEASAQPCDASEFGASCAEGVASFCSGQGYVIDTACQANERCAVDVSCILGPPLSVAFCFPDDAPPCPEPTDLFCDGGTMALCIDGNLALDLSFWECTEDDVPECR